MAENGGWWDEIEEPSEVDRKAAKLVNVLAKQPGDHAEKLKWITEQLPLMEAEALMEFEPEREPRKYGAKMCSLALRWYRQRLKQAPRHVQSFQREDHGPRLVVSEEEREKMRAFAEKTKAGIRRIS